MGDGTRELEGEYGRGVACVRGEGNDVCSGGGDGDFRAGGGGDDRRGDEGGDDGLLRCVSRGGGGIFLAPGVFERLVRGRGEVRRFDMSSERVPVEHIRSRMETGGWIVVGLGDGPAAELAPQMHPIRVHILEVEQVRIGVPLK